MEISLEQIDLVRQRTGVGYKEAQQALEAVGGSLVDALVFLEAHESAETEMGKRDLFASTDGSNGETKWHAQQESMQNNVQQGSKSKSKNGSNGNTQNRIVSSVVNFSKNSRIKVSLPGNRTVEIPTVLSAAGAILMPKAMAVSGLALLMTKCTLSMESKAAQGSDSQGLEDNS